MRCLRYAAAPRAEVAPAARTPAAHSESRATGPSRKPFRSGSWAGSGAAVRPPSRGLEEWIELACALERIEIVAAADVELADPDLRHRAPAALLHHLHAPVGLQVDANFFDRRALLAQQPVGRLAEGAGSGQVHQHFRHPAVTSPREARPAARRQARRRDSTPWKTPGSSGPPRPSTSGCRCRSTR